jgi:hypothetical protein
MAKKDIVENGTFMPTPIGEKFYLWTTRVSDPSVQNRELVLSAHGGPQTRAYAVPPAMPLYFYCPDTWAFNAPSLDSVASGRIRFYEEVLPDQCPKDYSLGKFQGRHGDDSGKVYETYAQIQNEIHAAFKRQLIGTMRFRTPGDQAAALADVRDVTVDILTIRHRRFRGDPSLFEALHELEKAGYVYEAVHCSFCRGLQGLSKDHKSGGWGSASNQGVRSPEGLALSRARRRARMGL